MKQVLILLMIIIVGAGVGWLGFLLFGDIATNTRILYLSQEEILKLEKDRVNRHSLVVTAKDGSNSNKNHSDNKYAETNLFFGQIDLAIELIKSEALKYQDKRDKVIFITSGFITGEDVTSISTPVHLSVIERLAKIAGSRQQSGLEDDKPNNQLNNQ